MTVLAVALGDSLTYGYPYGPKASWVTLAAQATGARLINAGQNGATAGDLLSGFAHWVMPHQPTYVIIGAGTNEALQGQPITHFAGHLLALLEQARIHRIVPILIRPIPLLYPEEEKRLGPLRAVIHQQLCPQLDFYRPFIDAATGKADQRWYSDEVHPNRSGYRLLAEALLKSNALNELTSPSGPDRGRSPDGIPPRLWKDRR